MPLLLVILHLLLLVRASRVVRWRCPYHPWKITGLAVVAAFVSNISAMGSCTLDGQPMGVELVRNRLLCTSNYTIKHGGHQLIVTPNLVGLPLLFDFLKYDRGEPDPVADADVIYEDPSIESTSKVLEFSGDSLDLTFVGEWHCFKWYYCG